MLVGRRQSFLLAYNSGGGGSGDKAGSGHGGMKDLVTLTTHTRVF